MAKTKEQLFVMNALKPHLYKKYGYDMFDMEGTYGDYKVAMVFRGVTPSGNVNVSIPSSHGPSGIGNFRNKRAMLRRNKEYNDIYLWIEDGTGSLSLGLK